MNLDRSDPASCATVEATVDALASGTVTASAGLFTEGERMPVKSICGVILVSKDPDALARFYAEALDLAVEREEHAALAPHWGVDIRSVHFGIHPPENFKRETAGQSSAVLAFDVRSLQECEARLERLGAPGIETPIARGLAWLRRSAIQRETRSRSSSSRTSSKAAPEVERLARD